MLAVEVPMGVVDETSAEEDEVQQVVQDGSADIDAGRYRTMASPDEERRLRDDMMIRLQLTAHASTNLKQHINTAN